MIQGLTRSPRNNRPGYEFYRDCTAKPRAFHPVWVPVSI